MKQILLLAFSLTLIKASAQNTNPVYKYNKQNVVASKLIGTWKLDVSMTTNLCKTEDKDQMDLRDKKSKKEKEKQPTQEMTIEIKADSTVVQTIPASYNEILKNKEIYLAGTFTMKDKKYPFILIELEGNMQLVWFRERDGASMGDSESFIVTIAAAKDKTNDLLFTGGDFNNQPFKAFKRIK